MAYADLVIADGASAYWRLGETSGTTAVDVIGAKNGTISGGVTLNQAGPAVGNRAMAFDGASGKIVTAGTIAIPAACSIEAWIKFAGAQTNRAFLSNRFTVQEGMVFFSVGSTGNDIYVSSYQGGSDRYLFGTTTPNFSAGAWHHVVWTTTGSAGVLYVDGVVDAQGAPPHVALTDKFQIGYVTFANNYFYGTIDEVAIYPLVVTATQVATHYTVGRQSAFPAGSYPDRVVTDGATAYWRLGETSGTTAVDQIGNNHGTISGGVTLGQAGALRDGDTAMTFNGTSGVITMASVLLPAACTIETWLKTNQAGQKPALSNRDTATAGQVYYGQAGVGANPFFVFVNQMLDHTGVKAINDNQWHHCVWATDGT